MRVLPAAVHAQGGVLPGEVDGFDFFVLGVRVVEWARWEFLFDGGWDVRNYFA